MDVRRLIVGVVALCALLASPACGADDTVAAATRERIGAIEQSLCSGDAKVKTGKQSDSKLPDEIKEEVLALGLRFSRSTTTDTYASEVWVGRQCLQFTFTGPRDQLRIRSVLVDAGASTKFPDGLICGLDGGAPHQMPITEYVTAILEASKTVDGRHTTSTTVNGELVQVFTCSKPERF